jgi:hypothetical protein
VRTDTIDARRPSVQSLVFGRVLDEIAKQIKLQRMDGDSLQCLGCLFLSYFNKLGRKPGLEVLAVKSHGGRVPLLAQSEKPRIVKNGPGFLLSGWPAMCPRPEACRR